MEAASQDCVEKDIHRVYASIGQVYAVIDALKSCSHFGLKLLHLGLVLLLHLLHLGLVLLLHLLHLGLQLLHLLKQLVALIHGWYVCGKTNLMSDVMKPCTNVLQSCDKHLAIRLCHVVFFGDEGM